MIVLVAAIAVLAVTLEAVVWMAANPLPSYWDEAGYYASTVHNTRLVRHFGLSRFGVAWNFDPFRPPINVILPLPVSLVAQNSLLAMRLVSWFGFLIAALLIALTVKRVTSSKEAAALTLMMLVASPILVQSAKMLGTEYALFLAIAGVLFFAFGTTHRFAWIGLGICIGLGFLAKASFVVVIVPLLLVHRKRTDIFASPLGLLIASTWWIHNAATAIRLLFYARGASAHSLGPPWQLHTFVRWCQEFVRCSTGYGLLAAIAIIIAIIIATSRWRDVSRFAIATALAAFALIAAGYSGTNHNPRHLAPAVLLLIAAAASLATQRAIVVIVVIVLAQIAAMTLFHRTEIVPSYVWRTTTEVMAPVEQWDFTPLRLFVDRTTRIAIPRVAVMGAGYQLNPANVECAWLDAGRDASVQVVWRPERGIAGAAAFATQADVAITAPQFSGDPSEKQPETNVHNAEFAKALAASGQFAGPFPIEVGVNERAQLAVFVRRTAAPPQR